MGPRIRKTPHLGTVLNLCSLRSLPESRARGSGRFGSSRAERSRSPWACDWFGCLLALRARSLPIIQILLLYCCDNDDQHDLRRMLLLLLTVSYFLLVLPLLGFLLLPPCSFLPPFPLLFCIWSRFSLSPSTVACIRHSRARRLAALEHYVSTTSV